MQLSNITRLIWLIIFFTWQFLNTVSAAEDVKLAPYNDVSPPKIDHTPIGDTHEKGAPLTIHATISDNTGVKEVTLFYRSKGMTEYRPLTMHLSDQESNRFVATIQASEVTSSKVEYYIQATDTNGNTVLRAGRLFPLSVAIEQSGEQVIVGDNQQEPDAEKSSYTWAWILGGIVVAGIVAAVALDSGGDDGGSSAATGNEKSTTGNIEVVGPAP